MLVKGNPWLTAPKHQGLVDLGTHSLHASIAGRARQQGEPVAIFFTGAGAPMAAHVRLQQHLSSTCRVLFYDRAGYDQSTRPNGDAIMAIDTAKDLAALLDTVGLDPPYILMAHSYGGIIAREFLELEPKAIVGVVLLDVATELMLRAFKRVPPAELEAVAKNVDWAALTNLKEESGLSDEQWDYAMAAVERTIPAAKAEDTHASARHLAGKRQLERQVMGNAPLSVVRLNMAWGWQQLLDAGVRLGEGTVEERRRAQGFIDDFGAYGHELSRGLLDLSGLREYTYYGELPHDGPFRNRQLVSSHLNWVLESLTL